MNDYKIFFPPNETQVKDKLNLRVDLIGEIKINEIPEFKDFNVVYVSKGHDDLTTIKGKLVKRKVRYIQVFQKR